MLSFQSKSKNRGRTDVAFLGSCECAVKWLMLYISLTRVSTTQITGKTSFLNVSVRLFPEEISFRISRLSNISGYRPILWEPRTKWQRNNEFTLSSWAGTSSSPFLRHRTYWFSGFQTGIRTYTISSSCSQAFGLRLMVRVPPSFTADSVSWDLVSIIMWANSYSQSPMHSLLVLFAGEPN